MIYSLANEMSVIRQLASSLTIRASFVTSKKS